jgi:phosphoglucomutase
MSTSNSPLAISQVIFYSRSRQSIEDGLCLGFETRVLLQPAVDTALEVLIGKGGEVDAYPWDRWR